MYRITVPKVLTTIIDSGIFKVSKVTNVRFDTKSKGDKENVYYLGLL